MVRLKRFYLILFLFFYFLSSLIKCDLIKFDRKLQGSGNITDNFMANTDYGECLVKYCGEGACAINNADCLTNETSGLTYCSCRDGFITFPNDDSYECCYEQKSSTTAIFLEMFISFGFGHFYVGNVFIGMIKALVYSILTISCGLILWRIFRSTGNQGKSLIFKFTCTICLLLCSCAYIGWQIIDSILFSIGGYVDKNGAPLSGTQ